MPAKAYKVVRPMTWTPGSTAVDTWGVDRLRPWALWISVIATFIAAGIAVGSGWLISPPRLADRIRRLQNDPSSAPSGIDSDDLADLSTSDFGEAAGDPPGLGIPNLALPIGLLLCVLVLMVLATLIGHRATSIVNVVVNIVGGLVGIVVGFIAAIVAFTMLLMLVALFLAAPFGTLAYLAAFGFFDVDASSAALVAILVFLIVGAVFLVVAQQRVLTSKRLMFFVFLVLGLTLVTLILHTIVPGFLVSITDALAALITAIVAVIWGIAMLIGGIIALIKQLNLGRAGTAPERERERADVPARPSAP